MKNSIIVLLLISGTVFSQGLRIPETAVLSVKSSYAQNQVVGGLVTFTQPDTRRFTSGYMPNLFVISDTAATTNFVRLYIFSDTLGFNQAAKDSSTWSMTDTMSMQFRGTFLLSFTASGATMFSENDRVLSYIVNGKKKVYGVPVAESACKFKFPTGKLRFILVQDDY